MGRQGMSAGPGLSPLGPVCTFSFRQILSTQMKRAFFTLVMIGVVEGVHTVLVVAPRILAFTDRFLLLLTHVLAASAMALLLGPVSAVFVLAWSWIENRTWLLRGAIVAVVQGAGCLGYAVYSERIERAINFILRRFFDDIAYDLSPAARPLWQIIVALAAPCLVACWSIERIQRFARGRVSRGQFSFPAWLGFLAIAFGAILAWWNTTFWVNLYQPFHMLIFAGIVVMVMMGQAVSQMRCAALPLVLLSGLLSLPGLHIILDECRTIEPLVFGNTTTLREEVRLLRTLTDRDRDGSSRFFGGDDPDDGDPQRFFGRLEIPANGLDDNGLGGDVGEAVVQPIRAWSPATAEPMDTVILISVDALRWDALSYLNAETPATPRLDALSEASLRFRRAYSQASYTRYSFGSMWHSCVPDQLDGGSGVGRPLPLELQKSGIRTIAVVPELFKRLHFDRLGFDEFIVAADDAERERTSESITDRALEMIGENARGFFWIHYFDPHSPYQGERAGTPHERYLEEVQATDRAIGRLLEGLAKTDGSKRAICLMADHGDEFGDHGGAHHGMTLYEEVIHVPLLVSAPDISPRDISQPVRLLDLAPTVLELFHVTRPPSARGRSLLPGPDRDQHRDHRVVSMSETGVRSFIEETGRWKLIWKVRDDYLEVFDLSKDPHELRNLVDELPERTQMLIHALEAWMAEEHLIRSQR